ncbi:MAG: helix-turn-helix domain-containing protein [Gemmatimonas sp.]
MVFEDIDAHREPATQEAPSRGRLTRLVIIDRRALIRECLASSLRTLGQSVEILRGADAAQKLHADDMAGADVILLSTGARPALDVAVQGEVTWLHLNSGGVPVVLVGERCDLDEARYLIAHLHLRGYIPLSSTLATAGAALATVACGGTYLPLDGVDEAEESFDSLDEPSAAYAAKLTARECAVLLFLRKGMPNKIIAHRLGISQSTVKAHIHSIMTKLHSRNRTEAAVAAATPLFGARLSLRR